jgi:hypothetical protein
MHARHSLARLTSGIPLLALLQACAASVGTTPEPAPPPAAAQAPEPPEPAPEAPPFEPSAPGEIASDAVKSDRRFIVGDLIRANIASSVEQGPPGVLRVALAPGFHTQGSRQFYFRRLGSAYHTWVAEGESLVIELWEAGAKIGEYRAGEFAMGTGHTAPLGCPDDAATGLCAPVGQAPPARGDTLQAPSRPDGVVPPPAPPAPVEERAGLQLQLGVGAGIADLACRGCDFSSETGVSGFFAVGSSLGPKMSVGVEATGWTRSEGGNSSRVYSLMAYLTEYLQLRGGPFLRGGLGLVGYRQERSAGDLSAKALGFSGRVGYEIGAGRVVILPYAGLVRTFAGADFEVDGNDIGFNAALSNVHFGVGIGLH